MQHRLTPKENYMRMLAGQVPDWVPSYFIPGTDMLSEALTTPISAPPGVTLYSPWGVPFIGSENNQNGAIPKPGHFILDDITKWRDVIKNPDLSGIDWEAKYKKDCAGFDRSKKAVGIGGADYFQTLISFMGFTEGLIAMHEEPEEVYALLDYVSEYFMEVMERQFRWVKPDIYMVADDCAASHAPFFSVDMYRRLIKPFHKRAADFAMEHGAVIERHDCGKCESFIPDWMDFGVRAWNPAQPMNDLPGIKKRYAGRLAICGGWNNTGSVARSDTPEEELLAALREYVDTLAPGGGFVFGVMISDPYDREAAEKKNALVRKFYDEYVYDWYNRH